MNPFFSKVCFATRELIGLAIIALLVIGANRLSAEEPLPSQDEAIARAVESHPDIVAAKAKLALAESELNGKRMEVSRQVLQAYSNLKALEAQASAIKAKMEAAHREFDEASIANKGAVSATERDRLRAELQSQESALVQSMLQREQTDKELRLLLGNKAPTPSNAAAEAKSTPQQVPQGPIVNAIRHALSERTSVDVADQPISAWCDYISDRYQIPIQLHPDLKGTVDPTTTPIRVNLKNAPILVVFQAIEDLNNRQIQFVIRDYGILLMDREQAEKSGFMPLLDFAKAPHPAAAADDPDQRPGFGGRKNRLSPDGAK